MTQSSRLPGFAFHDEGVLGDVPRYFDTTWREKRCSYFLIHTTTTTTDNAQHTRHGRSPNGHNLTPSHLSTSVLFHPHPVPAHPSNLPGEAHHIAYVRYIQQQSQCIIRALPIQRPPMCNRASAVTHGSPASNDHEVSPFPIFPQPQSCSPRLASPRLLSSAPSSARGTILSQILQFDLNPSAQTRLRTCNSQIPRETSCASHFMFRSVR
jgi:hypothetical protein